MKSSLSPPVEQLLVDPVRRHLLPEPAAAGTTTDQGDDETKKPHVEGTWIDHDGSFNWAMLDAYLPTPQETLSDDEVVARMRAILNDKLAEAAAKAAASSPSPPSPPGAPPTAAAIDMSSSSSSSAGAAAGQGRGQPRPGGGGGRKGKGNAGGGGGGGGGSGGSAEAEAEREIARLEREEALEGEAAGEGGAAGEREKKLSEEARTYDLAQWEHIVRTALLLQKAAPHVHRYMMSLTPETFEATYASRFPAFHHHAPEVFALHREGKSIEALLQLAPLIERHISDLYLAATRGRGDGRLILRDLLLTPQLNALLGPRKVGVLRSLIGTPLGLNIRNVAWHGFLSEADFYPGYVSLILALALSLVPSPRPVDDPATTGSGGGGARHAHHSRPVAARPLLAIAPLVELTWRAESGGCLLLAEGHDDNDESRRQSDGRALAAVRRLVRRSGFVVAHSRFLLESAIDALERPTAPPQYYQCLVCALPALEHCLRRLYVATNGLPPPLLTAVMYDYYTTLDVIVGPTVEATGRPNLLRQELGDSIMTALWDFFVCPEGPRLRDRISHGEADPAGISQLLCDRVLSLVGRLCLRYDRPEQAAADDDNDDASLFARVVAFYDGYTSSFHTKDVLVRKLVHYFDAWAAFAGRHGPGPTNPLALSRDRFGERGLLFATAADDDDDGADARRGGGLERARASGLLRLPTLFLSSFELAAIVQLRIVVSLSERVIAKIEERFDELKGLVDSRKARSRQRNSYAQLCTALPYYCAMSQYVGQLVEARLRLLDRLAQGGAETGDGSDASSQEKRERVLGELRQFVVCAEKQLSQLAQGDKWSDVSELFNDLFQATTAAAAAVRDL